jgi:hypothetical protein
LAEHLLGVLRALEALRIQVIGNELPVSISFRIQTSVNLLLEYQSEMVEEGELEPTKVWTPHHTL